MTTKEFDLDKQVIIDFCQIAFQFPQIELKRIILGQKTSTTELKVVKTLIQEKLQDNYECIKLLLIQ